MYPVKVLGSLALIDGGETDWKVVVVRADTPESRYGELLHQVDEIREWFRNYKTAEGKGLNEFHVKDVISILTSIQTDGIQK